MLRAPIVLPQSLRGYGLGCAAIAIAIALVVVVGCSTTTSGQPSGDVSAPHVPTHTSLVLEPPPDEAWIIVKNRTAAAMVVLDKKGASFGIIRENEEYVVRLLGGERHRLYATSPHACFQEECPEIELATLEVPVRSECVYLASISHVWSYDGLLRLAFVQGNLPLALKGPLDLSRVGRPRNAGAIAGFLGKQIAIADAMNGNAEWSERFATCRVPSASTPISDAGADAAADAADAAP